MHNYLGKHSRRNLILVFTFITALTLLSFPIDVSAKAGNPEVKISSKTLYVGYEPYKIAVSNLAKGVTYICESDNKYVATVDKSNKITPVRPGKATIAVTIKQKGKTYRDKIAITVKAPYIKITEYAESMEVNSSKTWKAKVYGSANTTLTWSTSDASVATVNRASGKLTAHSVGEVIITATSGNLMVCKKVVIKESVSMKSEIKETKKNTAEKDFVLECDTCTKVLPNTEFDRYSLVENYLPLSPVWSTSNPELATIDNDGWVNTSETGSGTVIITARVGNKQISTELLVLSEDDYQDYVDGNYKPNKVAVDTSSEILEEASTQVITPMPEVTPSKDETPDYEVTKPTPTASPNPVNTPVPEKNTSDYTYETRPNGIVITGIKDKSAQNAVIPSEINGKAVICIKYKAFNNLENIQSIVIPDTVTSIEFEAIKACPNLESLTIPASVTYMSDIDDCPKLKYLTIGMKKIDGIKFRNCVGLERITALEGVTEIGGFGYLHCLNEVILPKSLQAISRKAFVYCINLVRINIPDMAEIGERAFENCSSLTGLSISDSFAGSIGEYAFANTPIETIGAAYKNGCLAILSDTDMVLFNEAQRIISSVINPSDSDGLKVLAIHDWIVKNTEYYNDGVLYTSSSKNIEAVLLNHKAVCQGYAETFKLFMDLLNIPCEIVNGIARGYGHSWNLIYLDGEWYHIDCTWDDPVPDGGPNFVSYYHCLIPDFLIEQLNHSWDRTAYPAAYGTKWADYVNDHIISKQ